MKEEEIKEVMVHDYAPPPTVGEVKEVELPLLK